MIDQRIEAISRKLDITMLLVAGTFLLVLVLIALMIGIRRKKTQGRKNSNAINSYNEDISPAIKAMPANDDSLLKRFLETVETSLDDSDISIEDLARSLGTSRAQLFRKIKAESGHTPNDLIQEIRLEKAYYLLKTTQKSISEVAYAVGFSSPSYFSKCYKRKFGIAPSQAKD